MLVLKERVVSGLEIKKSTTIKSIRTELSGQFLLDAVRQSAPELGKKDPIQGYKKDKKSR